MVVFNWKTPHEKLFGAPPSDDHLTVIGCLCYVAKDSCNRDKSEVRGVKCVFLDYMHG